MENKKILVEENRGNAYRRLLVEQGIHEVEDPDYVHNLKQGAAKNTIIFINGFMKALIPAVLLGLIIIGLCIYAVTK